MFFRPDGDGGGQCGAVVGVADAVVGL